MYLIIEHCNGEIMSDPFILLDENQLSSYINGEFVIYDLNNLYVSFKNDIAYIKEFKEEKNGEKH